MGQNQSGDAAVDPVGGGLSQAQEDQTQSQR